MEYATLIFALPGNHRCLPGDVLFHPRAAYGTSRPRRPHPSPPQRSIHRCHTPDRTIRQRLASLRSYPDTDAAERFSTKTVVPALRTAAEEFRKEGYEVTVETRYQEGTGLTEASFQVEIPDHRSFLYEVAPVETPRANLRCPSGSADEEVLPHGSLYPHRF